MISAIACVTCLWYVPCSVALDRGEAGAPRRRTLPLRRPGGWCALDWEFAQLTRVRAILVRFDLARSLQPAGHRRSKLGTFRWHLPPKRPVVRRDVLAHAQGGGSRRFRRGSEGLVHAAVHESESRRQDWRAPIGRSMILAASCAPARRRSAVANSPASEQPRRLDRNEGVRTPTVERRPHVQSEARGWWPGSDRTLDHRSDGTPVIKGTTTSRP